MSSSESLGKPKLNIDGLFNEWESQRPIREHLKENGSVLFPDHLTEPNVKTTCHAHIIGLLSPVIRKMRDTPGMPQPCVEPLREQVSLLYKTLSKQVPETQVIHDSWCLRKFLGFVKMKTRIHKPSTAALFQQLCLMFDPELQELVDEINRREAEKRAARLALKMQPKDATEDPDAYDHSGSESTSSDSDGDDAPEIRPSSTAASSHVPVVPDPPAPPAGSGAPLTEAPASSTGASAAAEAKPPAAPGSATDASKAQQLALAKERLAKLREEKEKLKAKLLEPPTQTPPVEVPGTSGGRRPDPSNLDTLPMEVLEREEAAAKFAAESSPVPAASPSLSPNERRDQYKILSGKGSPTPTERLPGHAEPSSTGGPSASVPKATGDEPADQRGQDVSQETHAEAQEQADDPEADGYVSRNQQMTHKSQGKNARKRKAKQTKPKTGGKKAKKAKAGKKSKETKDTGLPKSTRRVSRKRKILSTAKSTNESPLPKPKRAKRKSLKSGASKPVEDRPTPAPKRAARKAPKAKAEPKAKSKTRAVAKGKARASPRRNPTDALLQNPLRNDTVVFALIDWAEQFGPEFDGADQVENFKKTVRDALQPLETTCLNIYWSRCGCGVKAKEEGQPLSKAKDLNNFSFNTSLAPFRSKNAVAIRCAELAALGYEKGEEGYEKEGASIRSLKVNGALALLFLAHPELREGNLF